MPLVIKDVCDIPQMANSEEDALMSVLVTQREDGKKSSKSMSKRDRLLNIIGSRNRLKVWHSLKERRISRDKIEIECRRKTPMGIVTAKISYRNPKLGLNFFIKLLKNGKYFRSISH